MDVSKACGESNVSYISTRCDPLLQLQRVGILETPVLQAFRWRPPGNCSENCRRGVLMVQQALTADFCKLLKTRGKWHRVFTGDPHVRRRCTSRFASGLFSSV